MDTDTDLIPVEYSDERVLTSEQLADFYECTKENIKKNFSNHSDHFVEGKHYFKLEGDVLKEFKNRVNNIHLVGKNANTLYLWTKRGAARHCKMLGTEKAWQVFEMLEETYFNVKEILSTPTNEPPKTASELSLYHVVKDAIDTAKLLEIHLGVKKGMAYVNSMSTAEKFYNVDLDDLKKLAPPADHDIGFLTPTQIGKKVGLTAQKVNAKLVEKGLQVKEGTTYRLTELGKNYGESVPFERNGHSDYQIKWTPNVLEFFITH